MTDQLQRAKELLERTAGLKPDDAACSSCDRSGCCYLSNTVGPCGECNGSGWHKGTLPELRESLQWALGEIERLRDALLDCASGLKYIRQQHGELYGVGFDRALGKADAILSPNAGIQRQQRS